MKTYPAVRFLAPIVVALVLGPLTIGIALWLANVTSNLFNGTSSTLADEGGFFSFWSSWPISSAGRSLCLPACWCRCR